MLERMWGRRNPYTVIWNVIIAALIESSIEVSQEIKNRPTI
jgi:hypothetical protein